MAMSKRIKVKSYYLSTHAAERLIERKISLADLDKLILNPDGIISQGDKYILFKKFEKRNDNNLAAVILEKKEDLWLVITLMINFQVK